jgi:hypothetical protein
MVPIIMRIKNGHSSVSAGYIPKALPAHVISHYQNATSGMSHQECLGRATVSGCRTPDGCWSLT